MLLMVPKDEMEKAAVELAVAAANGFTHCDATFSADVATVDGNLFLKFDGLIMKAHQSRPSLNWGFDSPSYRKSIKGFQPTYRTHRVVNGQLVEIPEEKEK
jgi:hypothetical protein